MNKLSTTLASTIFLMALQTPAFAQDATDDGGADRGDRIEQRLDRRGDRIDRRLDRRGDVADRRLDRRGHRVDRRYDRAGRRIDRRSDRRRGD